MPVDLIHPDRRTNLRTCAHTSVSAHSSPCPPALGLRPTNAASLITIVRSNFAHPPPNLIISLDVNHRALSSVTRLANHVVVILYAVESLRINSSLACVRESARRVRASLPGVDWSQGTASLILEHFNWAQRIVQSPPSVDSRAYIHFSYHNTIPARVRAGSRLLIPLCIIPLCIIARLE